MCEKMGSHRVNPARLTFTVLLAINEHSSATGFGTAFTDAAMPDFTSCTANPVLRSDF
jgi:hypothetical protein